MKIECLILCNAIAICEAEGRHFMRDDLENHLKARSFRSEQWLNISDFKKRPVKAPSIWKESLTWTDTRICIARG